MLARTRQGSCTLLRMAHGKANAFDLEFLKALHDALAEEEAGDARALVIVGTGTIYSAGVDLFRVLEGGPGYLRYFLPALTRMVVRLFAFPKPAVAAVNGHAIAGGCIIACGCDMRVMARGAFRIGVPELKVGVPFPLAPLEVMRYALPPGVLDEAVLAGKTFLPEEALQRGVVHELAEESGLLARAVAIAEELAAVPPASFAATKRRLRGPAMETLERRLAESDRETLEAWSSDEVLSAMRAYVEKTLKKR